MNYEILRIEALKTMRTFSKLSAVLAFVARNGPTASSEVFRGIKQKLKKTYIYHALSELMRRGLIVKSGKFYVAHKTVKEAIQEISSRDTFVVHSLLSLIGGSSSLIITKPRNVDVVLENVKKWEPITTRGIRACVNLAPKAIEDALRALKNSNRVFARKVNVSGVQMNQYFVSKNIVG